MHPQVTADGPAVPLGPEKKGGGGLLAAFENPDKLNLAGLLNVLDGVVCCPNRIVGEISWMFLENPEITSAWRLPEPHRRRVCLLDGTSHVMPALSAVPRFGFLCWLGTASPPNCADVSIAIMLLMQASLCIVAPDISIHSTSPVHHSDDDKPSVQAVFGADPPRPRLQGDLHGQPGPGAGVFFFRP